MKKIYWLLFASLPACTGPGKGLLTQFDSAKPLDQAQLARHCDLEDTAACFLANEKSERPLPRMPVIQGVAPENKAVFSVLLEERQIAKWFLLNRPTLSVKPVSVTKVITRPGSRFRIEQLQLAELTPAKEYELIAVDGNGMLIDHRRFQTFRPREQNLRFAMTAGSSDALSTEQASQWENLLSFEPELIFAIGDNVYADSRNSQPVESSPSVIWERNAETRATLSLFLSPKLIPVISIWNDHDFGQENGNENFAHKDEARKVTEAFFPFLANASNLIEGPGLSRAIKVAGQTFILFDNRSFRSRNGRPAACRRKSSPLCGAQGTPPDFEATQFGRVQEDWALSLLAKSGGPAWLIAGDPWFGGYYPAESYEGNHPRSFHSFLQKLRSTSARVRRLAPAFVFASGDRQLSEISKVRPWPNYETYEFTSSGIHAPMLPNPWKEFPNPHQLVGSYGIQNFSLFETSIDKGRLFIGMKSIGPDKQPLFQRSISIKPATP